MNKRELQEAEYIFPYHHIPQFRSGSFSETRHLFWGYEYAAYVEHIVELVGVDSFESLLDIGCGDGRLLLEIAVAHPGRKLVGTDFSERAIAFARAFAPQIDYRAGTLAQTIHAGETFSRITLIEVLEHIPPNEAPEFLKTLTALLSPGGRGIITVPSANVPINPKHFRHFTAESLRATLEPYAHVVSIEYLNAAPLGEKILRRLLANRLFILNESHLLRFLYRLYKKNYLRATEQTAQRLLAIIEKRP